MSDKAKLVPLSEWVGFITRVSSIPKIEPLCEPLEPGNYVSADQLGEDTRSAAAGWAELIRLVAKGYGLTVLISEMAVISDRRRQRTSASSFFASYIAAAGVGANELHTAYRRGFDRFVDGAKRYEYDDPIVIHPDLYADETGFFWSQFPKKEAVPCRLENGDSLHAYSFPLEGGRGRGKAKGVPQQLDDFVEVIQNNGQELGIAHILSGATLLLLPFLRPEFAMPGKIDDQDRPGTPGGCVFVVLQESMDAADARAIAYLKDIRWLLAEAAASESQSAFEAAARQREFAASMSHGTVTAIRSIGTSSVVKMLIRADAIDHDNPGSYGVDDLIFDLKKPSDNASSHKHELVEALRRMETAENIAASLAAMVEILAEGGAIREKFQSGKETSLRRLIDTAWSQAANISKARVKRESGAADERNYDWTLPSDYISDRFLVGVITELFQNAAAHGVTEFDQNGAVEVVVFGKEDSVCVQIQNRYESRISESRNISGFLSRAKLLMAEIKGIDLKFDTDEENSVFTVSLSLAALEITKNGASGYPVTEFFVSHPSRV